MNQEWNAEQALNKWLDRNKFSSNYFDHPDRFTKIHQYKENDHIPVSEWESCVLKTAKIVKELGSDYIDLFERAERELEHAKKSIETMQRINKIIGTKLSSTFNRNFIKP